MLQFSEHLVDKHFDKITVLSEYNSYDGKEHILTEYGLRCLRYLSKTLRKYCDQGKPRYEVKYFYVYEYMKKFVNSIKLGRIKSGSVIIELMLAFISKFKRYSRQSMDIYKGHQTEWDIYMSELLRPDSWYIFEYLKELEEPRCDCICIDTLYNNYGLVFVKKVVSNAVKIRYNKYNMLARACEKEDFEAVKYVFEVLIPLKKTHYALVHKLDNPLHLKNKECINAFVLACKTGNRTIINYLFGKLKPNLSDKSLCCDKDRYLVLKIYNPNEYYNAALIAACAGGQYNLVKWMFLYDSQNPEIGTRPKYSGYNLATISLVGCNEALTRYLMEEYNQELDPEFLTEICKFGGNTKILEYALKMMPHVSDQEFIKRLYKVTEPLSEIREYLVMKYNIPFNRDIKELLTCYYIKSSHIQQKILEANIRYINEATIVKFKYEYEYILKYIKYEDTIAKSYPNIIINIIYIYLSNLEYSGDTRKVIKLGRVNKYNYITNITFLLHKIIAFKISSDRYLIGDTNTKDFDCYGHLTLSKVTRKGAIKSWASIFVSAVL